ncbi:MAG: hopanoid biosynthesis-associated RND transporter HpnN, partial [Alphaproteobacteria bacterium]|nr:hopanoid biosynthesis-associated RND transporter HpnN [Alphaproteobacteria bacterium]
ESVSTILDLMHDPQTSPNTIDVLAPSLAAARGVAARLSAIPEVGQVVTLNEFVPDDQPAKLKLLEDANLLLDATINPFNVKPDPTDAETVAALNDTAKALRGAAGDETSTASKDAVHLASVLEKLAQGDAALRAKASGALVPGLKTMLAQISASLQASAVTVNTMPEEMVRDWVAKDGTARIQVFPKDTSGTNQSLNAFSKAVLKVVPDATGAPISIRQSGTTIVDAFIQAGVLSFVVITILLFIFLRRLWDVLLTIIPLLLTGLLTIAT